MLIKSDIIENMTTELNKSNNPKLTEESAAKSTKRRFLLLSVTLIFLGIVAGLIYLVNLPKNNFPFNENIQDKVSFRIVYPSSLPSGFTLGKESGTVSKGILSYTINTPSGDLGVIQQEKPNRDLPIEFPKTKEVSTDVGAVVISRFEKDEQVIINLTTDDSLLFINTTQGLTDQQIETLMYGMKQN
jgi:hypothetical protein